MKKEINENFLKSYLQKSADINYQTALEVCTHNHVNTTSCCWYHSIWQYLRLLDLVSSPTWHHEFYLDNLTADAKDCFDVLVSGLADYSMAAYVFESAKHHNKKINLTVIDLCKTPLLSAEWYAKQIGRTITTNQIDIFNLKGKFDIICADAFLTRFKENKLNEILTKFNNLLNKDGKVVTTIRIHDEKHICPSTPSKSTIKNYRNKALARSKEFPDLKLSPEEIADKAEYYAQTMVSNNLGTKEDILNAITNSGFKIVHIEDVEVKGELYPSRYLRLVFQKLN